MSTRNIVGIEGGYCKYYLGSSKKTLMLSSLLKTKALLL